MFILLLGLEPHDHLAEPAEREVVEQRHTPHLVCVAQAAVHLAGAIRVGGVPVTAASFTTYRTGARHVFQLVV